jgi:acetolactate synthase-1/2/3 large subunit
MKASKALLEMLRKYSVKHVFGLVGETSFPLYETWRDYPEITHIFGRDERNIIMMADAYARFSYKPAIAEVPGVGAPYTLPALIEAYISTIPIIMIINDIPTYNEKRNTLTEHEKEFMFTKASKEFITVHDASELPRLVRRAFRIATTARTGPVVLRVPMNIYEGEVSESEVYAQKEFSKFPSLRFSPEDERIIEALKILIEAKNPVIICGQGVLLSSASDEVVKLAEALTIPVGTTITGKGSFPENHPLSIGVIGARGGTKFSNRIVQEADVVFLIGTNTDSANTWEWRIPNEKSTIIQLDVSETELGNNYKVYPLLGDAKVTLQKMLKFLKEYKIRNIEYLLKQKKEFEDYVNSLSEEKTEFVNPVKLIKTLEKYIDEKTYITADPGTGAIYSSAYLKLKYHGRRIMYNYSLGGLGYSIPASIGAYLATRGKIISLTTDGNLAFCMGELETIKRINANIKIILLNNKSFGWIRAAMLSKYGRVLNGTEISEIDYSKISKAFGIEYLKIERSEEIEEVIRNSFSDDLPKFIEVLVSSEDKLLPPVPDWEKAKNYGAKYMG